MQTTAAELELEYPPEIDAEVFYDEVASQSEFLIGALANVDDELLKSGYDQMRIGQAHASRSLDLIRNCDPVCARYLMVMNAKLWLEEAKRVQL